MAIGSLNLRVSKGDFEQRIGIIENKMAALLDVIERYGSAKDNLDQFMESGDSNYEAMIDRIDVNIRAARKSYAALQSTRNSLQETVNQMNSMSSEVRETISAATGAVGSTINAALKIEEIL